MSKYTRIVSRVALTLAILAPSTAFAKIPFKGYGAREATSHSTSVSTGTTTLRRFGPVANKVSTLAACTHNHRYSGQHRM